MRVQSQPQRWYADAADVVGHVARDLISNQELPAPWAECVWVGLPCTSKNTCSNTRNQHIGCIQGGTGATGEGFETVRKVAENKRPSALVLENIPEVQTDDDGEELKYIVAKLQELGDFVSTPLCMPKATAALPGANDGMQSAS